MLVVCAGTAMAQTNTQWSHGIPDQVGIPNIADWAGANNYGDLGLIGNISTYTGAAPDVFFAPRYGYNPAGEVNLSAASGTNLAANEYTGYPEAQQPNVFSLSSNKEGQRSGEVITPTLSQQNAAENWQSRQLRSQMGREDVLPPVGERAAAAAAPGASFSTSEGASLSDPESTWYRNDSVSAGLARIQAETAALPCVGSCGSYGSQVPVARSPVSTPAITTYSGYEVSKGMNDTGSVIHGAIAAPFAQPMIPQVNAPAQLTQYSKAPAPRKRETKNNVQP